MTYRTLFGAIEMINIRKHNSYAQAAALQGVKVEIKKVRRVFEKLEEKTKDKMIEIHQEAIKRKVAEKNKKRKRK